jgi:hypothetical protein
VSSSRGRITYSFSEKVAGFGIPELVVVLLEHDWEVNVNLNTRAVIIYNPANRRTSATLLKKRAAVKSQNRPRSCLDSAGTLLETEAYAL